MQNGMYTRGKKRPTMHVGYQDRSNGVHQPSKKVTFWRLTVEFQGESRWLNAGIDFSGVEFDLQIGRCYARVERWQLIV